MTMERNPPLPFPDLDNTKERMTERKKERKKERRRNRRTQQEEKRNKFHE